MMTEANEPSWKRSLARVVLGILLAGLVYFGLEILGLGGSRRERDIIFSLPSRPVSQVEALYFSGDDLLRRVVLPASGSQVIDKTQLAAGRYQLQILLRSPSEN